MADALEENRAQLLDAVMAQIKGELDTFGKSISSEIDEKIQDMFPLQDNAKEDAVKEIKVTAQFLIDNAADDDKQHPHPKRRALFEDRPAQHFADDNRRQTDHDRAAPHVDVRKALILRHETAGESDHAV